MKRNLFLLLLTTTLLAACSSGQASPTIASVPPMDVPLQTDPTTASAEPAIDSPTATLIIQIATPKPAIILVSPTVFSTTISPALTAAPIPAPLDAADWKNWPVIPRLDQEMLNVYRTGQVLGRDTHVISVVGDCESSSDWFLKDFAKDERYYNLGQYSNLQKTIDHFKLSLGYRSYAAIRGATASTVLSPLWADPQSCESGETPLACEYRLHNPAFAFIALGTNDVHKRDQFEPNMRDIIEYTLGEGIIPVLVTKADNLEGDESINLTIAQLAVEYHLPLWNFWAAVQPLSGHGLQEDGAHLTFAPNFFDDPKNLNGAWAVRNLTALQVLAAMRTLE